jgi:hypothetical protein
VVYCHYANHGILAWHDDWAVHLFGWQGSLLQQKRNANHERGVGKRVKGMGGPPAMNETIKKIDAYLEQFVGSTMEQIIMQEAKREIEKLIKERDEARRELCQATAFGRHDSAKDAAAYRGWDCFKEEDE